MKKPSLARPKRVWVALVSALSLILVAAPATMAEVPNGGFDDGVGPWWSYGTTSLEVIDGQLCAGIPGGTAYPWDIGIGQNGLSLPAGEYEFSFFAQGDGGPIAAKVQLAVDPWTEATVISTTANPAGETHQSVFTAAADLTDVQVVFQVGGSPDPWTLCVDDVSIASTAEPVAPIVTNGGFDGGSAPWWTTGNVTSAEVIDGQFCVGVPGGTTNPWDVIVGQNDVTIPAGTYTFSFEASGEGPVRAIVGLPVDPYTVFASVVATPGATTQAYSVGFTTAIELANVQVAFQVGGSPDPWTLCIDNVAVEADATPPPPITASLVVNGGFDGGSAPWWTTGNVTSAEVIDGQFCVGVPGGTINPWDVIVGQNDLALPAGDYIFSFDASGEGPVRAIVGLPVDPYTVYSEVNAVPGPTTQSYTTNFTAAADLPSVQVAFQVGGSATPWTLCIDNVSVLPPTTEYVINGGFDDGSAPWWTTGNVTSAEIIDGQFCVGVPGGTINPWDVIVGQNDLALPAGDYLFSFDASGEGPVRAIIGLPVLPYTVYAEENAVPGPTTQSYEKGFTANEDLPSVQVAFQVGGSATPWTLCIDNVSVLGGGELPVYTPDTGPRVRVNQVGYLLNGPKKATLVTEAAEAVAWELMSGGAVAASGLTTPQGIDPSSALNVHTIDFGAVTTAGVYTLVADGEESYPFEIGTNAYETLRLDALNYYYPARSGIAIDGAIAGEEYARPAGHVSVAGGSDTNQGDYAVPCQPASESLVVYGEPWTCDYTLDVVGGWYDAGDHGKYVVNGGISVAQLMSTYERAKNASTADLGALADGTLAVPETGNGVPDVLDEARWELEFMLSMMVPEGEDLAGMVHHKIHDFGWTGLPLMPHNDGQARYLHRPSTAATLNLAATAAQGARLIAPYDPAFANELLAAARTTWAAALANPALYAPGADGANGGGPYSDSDVTDEFYWAAAELYLTTGEAEFENFVLASPHHTGNVFSTEGFSWGSVAALGRMDLATVPNNLPGRSQVIASVIAGADGILAVQQDEAFGLAYAGDANGDFVWGSNSQILNNMVVLGTAYDLSGAAKYRDAAVESMDYLLGRNALNISYVTGYGTVYSENQHSRWWAAQLNPALPHPPDGSVAGGPNSHSGSWDPTAAGLFTEGCAPQFCYVDNINSWATNEITINWNSALSWVASFLADQDSGKAPAPVCSVAYTAMQLPNNKLTGVATVKNTSASTLTDWELTWAYPGDQTVKEWAFLSQDGAWVAGFGPQASIKAGKSAMVPFSGDAGDLAKASPEQFWLNGGACTTTLTVTTVLPPG